MALYITSERVQVFIKRSYTYLRYEMKRNTHEHGKSTRGNIEPLWHFKIHVKMLPPFFFLEEKNATTYWYSTLK